MAPTSMNTNYNLFPQTQGNVYFLNNIQEINSIPVSNGVSAAFSLSEGILYLKTIQNGSIILNGYRLSPLEQITPEKTPEPEPVQDGAEQFTKILKSIEDRLSALEKQNLKGGNTVEW